MADRVVLLPLALEWFAVPILASRAVLPHPVIVPLVTAPPAVLGLCNVRGEVVPVFDTGLLLGFAPSLITMFAVHVEVEGHPAAFSLDGEPDLAALGERTGEMDLPGSLGMFEVTPPPPPSAAAGITEATLLDLGDLLLPVRAG